MIKKGIIKAISPKPEGRNAFTMLNEQFEGRDLWFSGYALDAKKGDEVEFELIIQGDFNNFSNIKVITPAAAPLNQETVAQSEPSAAKPSPDNPDTALRLTEAVIRQNYENIVTIDGAVDMYKSALKKLVNK